VPSPAAIPAPLRPLVQCVSGFAVLALGFAGLRRDWAWVAQPFYLYAWWGTILLLDGAVALRRGSSLLRRPRQAARVVLWSVSFWFFFELLNLRFQNWYYVGVFRVDGLVDQLAAGAFGIAAFATVFAGIFEVFDLLGAWGVFERLRAAPRRLPARVPGGFQALGAAMAAAAVCFPAYLAPLIWGSLSFLIDPLNYRLGARSLLRDVEGGDWGRLARALLAGLICGVIWESLNFWAPQKWIYTVRGLEGFKLFEMPLLGFLGFPALALDALAAYALIARCFYGNEGWEEAPPPYALAPGKRPGRRLLAASLPLHGLFWLAVSQGIFRVNVGSESLALEDLASLPPGGGEALKALGIERPRQLLLAAEDRKARRDIAGRLRASEAELERLLDEAELFDFKGIGAWHGALLRLAGVERIEDLARWDSASLHRRLSQAAGARQARVPRLDMVRVWVYAARSRGVVQNAASDGRSARE
jgi:hypothetical protein